MPVHDVGNVRFKKFRAGDFTPAQEAIRTYDCYPPPRGTIHRFNPETEVKPVIVPDYLQQKEIELIVEGTGAGATPAPQFPDIWNASMQGLDIKSLTIDLSLIPAHWLQVEACKVNEIHYEVRHKVWQIIVAAHVRVTLDGVVYPKGDTVAGFRICEPDQYRFVKIKSHSERCCPGTPGSGISEEKSSWWPTTFVDLNWHYLQKPFGSKWDLKFNYYYNDFEEQWGED